MPIHIVKVIREFTDSVSYWREKRPAQFCSEVSQTSPRWEPNTDIVEFEDFVIIKIELAGVDRNDISVKVKDGMIRICGVRREKMLENRLSYHQLEIKYGSFQKNIHIPQFMEHNQIDANLIDGILEIVISKDSQVIEVPINNKSENEE